MSQSYPAVPAKPSQVLSFPTNPKADWKARFDRIFDYDKGHILTFPFTYIKDRQALFDLYKAIPQVFSDYPGIVDTFFDDTRRACEVAEEAIEKERLKNLPGDPAALIRFRPAVGKEVAHG
jgi:hypothetical protein